MVKTLFEAFKSKRIVIVGDVMLDAYLIGNVTRISPEAPVPIVNLKQSENRLGGAANVALNIVALGAEAIICAVVGEDKAGNDLVDLFAENKIDASGLILSQSRTTTVKTRILGNNQQLLRVDSEHTNELSVEEQERLVLKVISILDSGVDALIFEDYNKGVLTPGVIDKITKECIERGIPTTVDPKKDNFLSYKNVTLFKPNLKELKEGLGVTFDFQNKSFFEAAVEELENKLNNEITFVTLSEHGVFIKSKSEKYYIPAHVRTIADVSGAGDTVISVATLCLTLGLSIDTIAAYANLAGGLVCEESGVVSIQTQQLVQEIERLQFEANS
jgi:rfaE bifunctional protein kinase chain/domain